MAKTAVKTSRFDSSRMVRYFKETRAEVARVTWPTREQALRLTGIVLAVTTALAVVLALIDYVFSWVIGRVLASDVVVTSLLFLLIVAGGIWWAFVGRKHA